MDERTSGQLDLGAARRGSAMKRHNLRRLRKNWLYRAPELAETLSVNIATIRNWTKAGLAPIERRPPFLFLGSDIIAFLEGRRKKHKPLEPGELLCVRCNAARLPARNEIRLVTRSATTVDSNGACSACGLIMYRRVRAAEIMQKLGACTVVSRDKQATVPSSRAPLQMSLFCELGQ